MAGPWLIPPWLTYPCGGLHILVRGFGCLYPCWEDRLASSFSLAPFFHYFDFEILAVSYVYFANSFSFLNLLGALLGIGLGLLEVNLPSLFSITLQCFVFRCGTLML